MTVTLNESPANETTKDRDRDRGESDELPPPFGPTPRDPPPRRPRDRSSRLLSDPTSYPSHGGVERTDGRRV